MRRVKVFVVLLVCLFGLSGFAAVGSVFGNTDVFGYANYNDSLGINLGANGWYGINFTNNYGTTWYGSSVNFRAYQAEAFLGWFTICDSNKVIIYEQGFTFSTAGAETLNIVFNGYVAFESGHTYWLGFVTNGTVLDGTGNDVRWSDASNSYGHPTNPTDMVFAATNGLAVWIVAASTMAESSPAPSGSAGVTLPPDGSVITGFDYSGAMLWIAALLLMLVPPFILGVFMRGGKWGFLIGLAIGTGLSYFVFISWFPIWLVILVAIGLGAAFLTSVKEGS